MPAQLVSYMYRKAIGIEEKSKIAVFIDFDNIEIGVKSTLEREFDVAVVLDALKERGEIVTKIAYANWNRQETSTRQLAEHAVQMVQRDPSPRGDKNGADINLALDALEMAFTHDHINTYAIVSGDSDFIALVNKLKQYDKRVFVVGGRAFTSTILQKNCHEFISYESLLVEAPRPARHAPPPPQAQSQPQPHQQPHAQQQGGRGPRPRPAALELSQIMPLVDRALQVLTRREVRPQLGLLKSTMLQLDSTFNEKAYGAVSFSDFVEKLQHQGFVNLVGHEGRYIIEKKGVSAAERPAKRADDALPMLRDVLEMHRMEMDSGTPAESLAVWVREEQPAFDWKAFGFQEFGELLNFAQDKLLVRIVPDEEKGLIVHLGAEFHPPAEPEAPPEPVLEAQPEEEEEPQPVVEGQPAARPSRVRAKTPKKRAEAAPVELTLHTAAVKKPRVKRAPRKRASGNQR